MGKTATEVAASAGALPDGSDRITKYAETGDIHHLQIMATGQNISKVEEHELADGKSLFTHVLKSPVLDADGKIIGTQGILMDITEHRRAEAALLASEANLRSYIEHAPTGVFILDETGRYQQANPATTRITGYSEAELLTQHITDLLPPETRDFALGKLRQLDDVGQLSSEFAFQHQDGRTGFWRLDAVKLSPTRSLWFAVDITDRRRTDEALRQSEQRFRTVARLSSDFSYSCIHSADGMLTVDWITDSFHTLTGYSPAELQDMRCWMLITHPEDRAHATEPLSRLQPGDTDTRDFRLLTRSGRIISVVNRLECEADPAAPGGVRYFGAVQDITERTRAYIALKESEEKFSRVFHDAPVLIAISSLETGVFREVNREALRISGLTREEAIGRNGVELGFFDAGERDHVKQILAQHGRVDGLEMTFQPRNGSSIVGLVTADLITFDGQACLLTIAVDITERKRTKAALQERDYFLQKAYEMARIGSYKFNIVSGLWSSSAQLDDIFGIDTAYVHDLPGWVMLIAPTHRDEMAAYVRDHVVAGRHSFDKEYPIIRPSDGQLRWVAGLGELEFDAHGQPTVLIGTIQDITERRLHDEALRLSEERFRTILQSVDFVAVQGYATDGTTQYWNEASAQLYGYTAEEAIGRNLLDLIIPAEMQTGVREAIHALAATGQPIPASELTLRRKDGSPVTVFSSHVLVKLPGRPSELFCVDIDLTERRRAEAALRESETNYHKLFAGMLDGFALHEIICDDAGHPVDYRFLSVNPAFERLTGLHAPDVIGRRVREIMPDTESAWIERYGRVALTGEGVQFEEYSGVLRRHFEIAAFCPKPGQFATVFIDITERKQAEARSQLQLTALNAAANAIVITGLDASIEWANTAFTTVTGYTLAEAIGRNPSQLIRSDRHDADFFRSMWATILAGQVWHGEIVNRRKDGTLYTEDMTITPLRDGQGAITRFIAVKQDITKRKALEEQFRQAQKMEAIGQLAGGVAHDFNNILAAVLLHLSLLQEEPSLDPATRASLKELTREIQRGASLTRQLLTFSRQQAVELRLVDLHPVVNGLLKMLHRLIGEDIVITLSPPVGPSAIEADAGMLEQVVVNLCINARDAMPHGGRLTLGTDMIEIPEGAGNKAGVTRPGRFVRLSVTDTGEGMSPEILEHIFEPFFTTKTIGKGTGLGLATVYGIVQQHHGWISVESSPGRGTTFLVHLPAAAASAIADSAAEVRPPPSGQGETILIAEDESSLRHVLALTLRRNGYQVYEAPDGPAALKLWQQNQEHINLLVTD
ncbi:MAG: PAS domain S-box protein, partial [Lacunisphaera sp.]|nr:PAS domain S-box protein [Lacunisphaera sp.]